MRTHFLAYLLDYSLNRTADHLGKLQCGGKEVIACSEVSLPFFAFGCVISKNSSLELSAESIMMGYIVLVNM